MHRYQWGRFDIGMAVKHALIFKTEPGNKL